MAELWNLRLLSTCFNQFCRLNRDLIKMIISLYVSCVVVRIYVYEKLKYVKEVPQTEYRSLFFLLLYKIYRDITKTYSIMVQI